jgi:hypothetical protein
VQLRFTLKKRCSFENTAATVPEDTVAIHGNGKEWREGRIKLYDSIEKGMYTMLESLVQTAQHVKLYCLHM